MQLGVHVYLILAETYLRVQQITYIRISLPIASEGSAMKPKSRTLCD